MGRGGGGGVRRKGVKGEGVGESLFFRGKSRSGASSPFSRGTVARCPVHGRAKGVGERGRERSALRKVT